MLNREQMEDHQDHHPHYGIPELRQLMKGSVGGVGLPTSLHFPTATIPSELLSFNLTPSQPHYQHHRLHHFNDQEMSFVTRGIYGLCPDSSSAAYNNNTNAITLASTTSNVGGGGGGGFIDGGAGFGGGDGGGTGRWPRQETLTLLEIRSRLDHKFKEANQKGPLWDEVSRILSEEHGYHRSGKKCREKFENLYKYYRKTKEGKAGRQDGKHYRFFRQLEALYGDSNSSVAIPESKFMSNARPYNFHHAPSNDINVSNPPLMLNDNGPEAVIHGLHPLRQKLSTDNSLSLSGVNYNSSELETSSSGENVNESTRRKRRGWKAKIKLFIDGKMKRLVERQEALVEKLAKTIEEKERERMIREEEWRRIQAARTDKEHSFWTRERERVEARDVALIEALQCLAGRQLMKAECSSPGERVNGDEIQNNSENHRKENGSDQKGDMEWTESEITKLMEIRANMETEFQNVEVNRCSDEFLWEEVRERLTRLGFDQRSALKCKEKWEWISDYMKKEIKQINKKRKENSSSYGVYFPRSDENSMYNNNHGNGYNYNNCTAHDHDDDHHHHQQQHGHGGACFPFFMGDGGPHNPWESYPKGDNQ